MTVDHVRAVGAALALVVAATSAAADPAGRAKAAAACAVCHGAAGLSTTPDAPHLAGQPEIYLATQLRAYRSGARKHEVMNVIAQPLTDDEIAALARWYNAIKLEAKPPS